MIPARSSLKVAAWLRTVVRRMDLPGRTRSLFRVSSGVGAGRTGLRIDPGGWLKSMRTSRTSESRMQPSEERLTLALDSGVEGIWDCNLADRSIWISERWLARLGYTVDAIEARQPMDHIVHAEDRERLTLAMIEHVKGLASTYECEHRVVCGDGTSFWVLTRGRVVEWDGTGRAVRAVGTQIDITHRREAEARVAYLALHDDLTSLPNRRLLRQRLDRAVIRAREGRSSAAVLACDLDGFKAVNDTLGHTGGDRLLRIVADRLLEAVGSGDTVARLGGDEFALVLEGLGGPHEVDAIAKHVIAVLGAPIEIDGMMVEIGVGIGAAMVPDETITADDLLRRADIALNEAKTTGRDTYRRFEPALAARHSARHLLTFDMKDAIRRGDFHLVYQPVIDLAAETVTSFEALMRWRHPERGLISPMEFIPVAEETGLIVALGAWALAEACREATAWPDEIRVAVNVSTVQFQHDLERSVSSALDGAGLSADRLKLEVTESALMRDPERVVATLHRLRALGVRIALDDFGTGYSSLSYLRRFPFDKIKIDRTFIKDIAEPDAAAIVRAVVGLGERLGMSIVAEGVETAEQLDLVRSEGCDEVQGFLFSRPLPASEVQAFLRSRRASAAA
ncbi:GGDEF domain-containing protein [Methylobacterium bullatum]|nr:GGDEF domain-containing protein [Methylobacterium bullatum]